MCSIDRLRDIRALEFFLFGGIPEAAESMFERDSHHHFDVRKTRQGLADEYDSFVGEKGQVIGVIEVDPATGAVSVRKHDEHSSGKL
jgi:hypothetical protein